MSTKRGSWGKVERAEKHVNDLREVWHAFRDGGQEAYGIVGEVDATTGEHVGRFYEWRATPRREMGLIAGDAIHNLRSALDLLYCELVVGNGRTVCESDIFPIRRSPEKFKASLTEVKARIGVAAATTLEALKPYNGGHDAYWGLHQLDIFDKHRVLLTTVGAIHEVIHTVPVENPPDFLMGLTSLSMHIKPSEIRPLNDGDEVFRLDTEPHGELKYRFEISLHEPPIAECEPLFELLNFFLFGVRNTIEWFESAGHLTAVS